MQKEGLLWERIDGGKVHCYLCAHDCRIAEAKYGVCGVRQNTGGILYTLSYGELVASHVDPIEKKPLYHFLPGSRSYSIATIGCNFKCGFCQNWQISQVSAAGNHLASSCKMLPEQIIEAAIINDCASISYTYTEPTIFFEYAFDTCLLAKKAGLANVFVTNGYLTRQALEMVSPYLNAANVDLKSFNEEFYHKNCKGHLQPVLDTIAAMKELGIWLEVTTLLIPGENDSSEELNEIANFLAGIDINIPWHISRFHPTYHFTDHESTPVDTLRRAREIGYRRGLRYIYLGNVPEGGNTYCPHCQKLVMERKYMGVEKQYVKDGCCLACNEALPGVWS